MDEKDRLLLILWRAEEAIRPQRKSFLVMRFGGRNGPLIRHPGLRNEENEHPFIHHPRQDLEDLIASKHLRKRNRARGSGEQWEVDLTDQGRARAKSLVTARSFGSTEDEPTAARLLVDDRIAAARDPATKKRWERFREALAGLDEEEAKAFFRALRP